MCLLVTNYVEPILRFTKVISLAEFETLVLYVLENCTDYPDPSQIAIVSYQDVFQILRANMIVNGILKFQN